MKKLIFIILVLALWIPKLTENMKLTGLKNLAGVTTETKLPLFNLSDWFEGKYQEQYENYKSENFGFRNFLIRLYNQIDFSFFKKAHSNIVVGKDGYLFQYNYLDEITGKSFTGNEWMGDQIRDIKILQDYLASKNILLVTVLAPGKTYYYKDKLPDYPAKIPAENTNYNAILNFNEKYKINLLDLNKWFLQLKDTSRFPLFPKQGIHWNEYGMALSADTIVKYIEAKTNTDLPDVKYTLELPDTLRGTDYDLGDLLNVLREPPFIKMPYPKFNIRDNTEKKLRVLTVGDSFYWTIANSGIFSSIFENETFYYYCSSIYTPEKQPYTPLDFNMIKEVEKFDVILLLQSSGNYNNPGVNFMQNFDKEMKRFRKFSEEFKNEITGNPDYTFALSELSGRLHVNADSARSCLADSLANDKLDKLAKIKQQMRTNPEWLEQLTKKSFIQHVTLEEIMQNDAEWMLQNEKKGS